MNTRLTFQEEGMAVRVLVAATSMGKRDNYSDTVASVGGTLVGFAADDAELSAYINTPPGFDLLILDSTFPQASSLADVRDIALRLRGKPVFVARPKSALDGSQSYLMAGARAVISDDLSAAAFKAALTLIDAGHSFALSGGATASSDILERAAQLSERELQVLKGVCEGLQNKEIAHLVSVKEVTIKMHVRAIIRKLGAKNRTQAAMIARDLFLC